MPNASNIVLSDPSLTIGRKFLVIGGVGSGKSCFAATFPKPTFLFDFDGQIEAYRGKDVDYEQFELSAKGWFKFEQVFNQVLSNTYKADANSEPKKYLSIILDTASSWADLAMEKALLTSPERSPSGGPVWQIHYGAVKELLTAKLRKLVSLQGINVVVNCHMEEIADEESKKITGIQPVLPGALKERLPGYFGEVYYARFGAFNNQKPDYYLQTRSQGMYNARSNMSGTEQLLPMFVPNNYDKIIELFKMSVKSKQSK